MSLKIKLPLVSIIIMSLSLLLMNAVFYAYISNILIEDNKDKINQVLDMESITLENLFNTRKLEIDYLGQDALVINTLTSYLDDPRHVGPTFKPDYEELDTFFKEFENTRRDIRGIFVLSPSGYVVSASHPEANGMDLSDRDYYLDALNGKTTISDLIVDRIENETGLVVATPVYTSDKSALIGVLGILLDTTNASESIRSLVDTNVGDAYLIDQSGMIIFHTDHSLIGSRHTNPEIDEFFSSSNLSIPNNSEFYRDGVTYYIAYKSILNTPWILVIDQNINVIMSSANKALGIMVLIAFSVLLLSASVAILFARKITRPITELSRVMHLTTQGDLSIRSQYISPSELGTLSSDLNYMLDELTGAYEEVESKNDILVATEEELREKYEQLAQSQKALEALQEKYADALRGSRDVVWEWTYETNRFFASELWCELTGLSSYNRNITYVAFEELLAEEDREIVLKHFEDHWKAHSTFLTFIFSYLTPDDRIVYFLVRANTQWDPSGKPIKTSGIMADITAEQETANKLHDLAFNSQVTSLPNRHAYMMTLKSYIETEPPEYSSLTVFQMDIDNFMRINNTLGHDIGNEVLNALADRLKSVCTEKMQVFHLSADEFAFILVDISEENEITQIINSIYQLFNNPFAIHNKAIYTSMSTGISIYPNDSDTVNKLVQNADTAMFAAKHSGKSTYVFYTNLLSESVQKNLDMEDLLRRSIKDNLISMHYQPQYTVLDKRLNSFEALMRITTEDNKPVSPADFIPIAEENGLIIELGDWALHDVCKTIKELLHLGYDFEHISVNVSSIQLKQADFVEKVSRITKLFDIEPHYLELEVTESVLLSVVSEQNDSLSRLREMGYKIALDDFGTGYSSFSYLRTMPLSTLKIDKTFIDDLADSKKDQELVRQMIDLSHELGIKVIAEGVETKAQYLILKDKACDFIQGYYFSKPLNLEKTKELLSSERTKLKS